MTRVPYAQTIAASPSTTDRWPGYDGTGSYAFTPESPAKDKRGTDPDSADMATRLNLKADELRHAASQGRAHQMFDLGSLIEQGHLKTGIDLKSAYDIYERAADQGEERAMSRMCITYLTGWQRPINLAKSMSYCTQLEDIRPTKIFVGAYDFDLGLTGPADEKQALVYYLTAADAGSGEAMNRLGLKTEAQGKIDVARTWYQHAVREGSVEGMFNLARLVEKGLGGPADADEAQWLYVNAARRGHAGAAGWLAHLPSPPVPLRRVNIANPKDQMITDIVDGKPQPFKLMNAPGAHGDLFPRDTVYGKIEGDAVIHCYIRDDHHIDVCITDMEFPVGYNYAAVLQSVFSGNLTIAPQTPKGEPTAHSVFGFNLRWRMY